MKYGMAEARPGHIYVIEFSTGAVKVGMATDLARRLAQHTKAAHSVGASVARTWTGERLDGVRYVEDRMIDFCRSLGDRTAGAEWFIGLDFDAVVNYYNSVDWRDYLAHVSDRNALKDVISSELRAHPSTSLAHVARRMEVDYSKALAMLSTVRAEVPVSMQVYACDELGITPDDLWDMVDDRLAVAA